MVLQSDPCLKELLKKKKKSCLALCPLCCSSLEVEQEFYFRESGITARRSVFATAIAASGEMKSGTNDKVNGGLFEPLGSSLLRRCNSLNFCILY